MIRDEVEDEEEEDDDCMVLRTLQTALCSDTHRHVDHLLAFDKASYRCRPIAALVASVRKAIPSLAASDCGEAPLLVASGGGASAPPIVTSGCREVQSIIASACRSAHLVVERPHHWLHRT